MDPEYLFVAGAPRCGTTTLFDALARHPGVAPCRVKEPGFLYPEGFPLKGFRLVRFEQGMEHYQRLFGPGPGLRMEASANYLYAPGVAERIRSLFPSARVLLILRDPVDRLISEFRFALMMRVFPPDLTFDDYLTIQRRQRHDDAWREPHLRALSNGCYARFVKQYLSVLGRERVHVTWTETLNRAPQSALREICMFAGLEPAYFDSNTPAARNTARRITRPLTYDLVFRLNAWRAARIVAGKNGAINRLLRPLLQALLRHSTASAPPVSLAPAQRSFLDEFYRDEHGELESLLGVAPPWPRVRAGAPGSP